MTRSAWRQLTLGFPDPHQAESTATAQLAPVMATAETRQLITAWFFVRKGTRWRLRYSTTSAADSYLIDRLTRLRRTGHLTEIIRGIYEPELHAFGGASGMDAAHRLWHMDSRNILIASPGRRRELSIVMCAAMMRAAGLDWYEQGDVWARAAEHRDPTGLVPSLQASVQRLMTVDPDSLTHNDAPLTAARAWIEAFNSAGAALGLLHEKGRLQRGLREILTHHVLFAWNRRGLSNPEQAALAVAAKTVVFGADPRVTAPAGSEATS
ncbi:thiopeptide-type bacteriocin biosynthesis protein [Actinoplanes sp. NBC_00393]|uniref:thiopeptide-type bacteriocin biosynthesis protein n=1 Tax=Actinoplanes sp. NBC_00393 TaxID=2975953 RepID=UPI002E1FC3E4